METSQFKQDNLKQERYSQDTKNQPSSEGREGRLGSRLQSTTICPAPIRMIKLLLRAGQLSYSWEQDDQEDVFLILFHISIPHHVHILISQLIIINRSFVFVHCHTHFDLHLYIFSLLLLFVLDILLLQCQCSSWLEQNVAIINQNVVSFSSSSWSISSSLCNVSVQVEHSKFSVVINCHDIILLTSSS